MNEKRQFSENINLLMSLARVQAQLTLFDKCLEDYQNRVEIMANALATAGSPDVEK